MIKTIGVFLQEQLLGMRWLNQLVGNLLQAIGIDLESRMGASVQFFIYDIIKIFILLSVLIFSISYIPVSYTHLDVYKRQGGDELAGRTV